VSASFAMGGYATFVWPAYGISALGIACAIVLTVRAYRRAKTMLENIERENAP
jgi:heme exporter protein D